MALFICNLLKITILMYFSFISWIFSNSVSVVHTAFHSTIMLLKKISMRLAGKIEPFYNWLVLLFLSISPRELISFSVLPPRCKIIQYECVFLILFIACLSAVSFVSTYEISFFKPFFLWPWKFCLIFEGLWYHKGWYFIFLNAQLLIIAR